MVAELNGADGPLRDVKVTRSSSTFTQKWAFSGIADLKDMKTGLTTDADLVARLSAQRVNVAALDLRLLAQIQQSLRLHVTADLPHVSPKVFPTPAGATSVLHTSSSETAMSRLLLLALGVILGLAAIVLLVAGELRARRRRPSPPRSRESVGEARTVEPVAEVEQRIEHDVRALRLELGGGERTGRHRDRNCAGEVRRRHVRRRVADVGHGAVLREGLALLGSVPPTHHVVHEEPDVRQAEPGVRFELRRDDDGATTGGADRADRLGAPGSASVPAMPISAYSSR